MFLSAGRATERFRDWTRCFDSDLYHECLGWNTVTAIQPARSIHFPSWILVMANSMTHHRLSSFRISISLRLRSINDPSHLLLLIFCQIDVSGCKVLLQSLWFRGAWNSNHALGSNPSQSYLRQRATFPRGKLLDLLNNGFVLVEVFTLELGSWTRQSQLLCGRKRLIQAMWQVQDTYQFCGNHQVRNRLESCTGSHPRAIRDPMDCRLRM